MKVLFCASEVAPFASTGGLGDVSGSLPLALGKLGIEVMITMPRYRGLPADKQRLADNVHIYFVDHEGHFNRAALYGNERGDYPDNLKRFSFFCHESLSLAKRTGFKPDLVHANDWQTALLPVILKTKLSADPFFKKAKTLLTVHNLAYQGHFPRELYPELELNPALFSAEGFEFFGKINLLKGGLVFSDAISTVSPTYAHEIQTKDYGFWLEDIVKKKAKVLRGILNGIDTALWDPAQDRFLKSGYSKESPEGKKDDKLELQRLCGFEINPRVPLFGMVTRLAEQKGMDLFAEIADSLLSQEVQFVLLGDGDAVYKTVFRNIAARHAKKAAVSFDFDLAKAHRIYAGADFFLMPSLYEPCGLGQLISLKYGTIPVARRTGGLADTIVDADKDPKNGNGFLFEERNADKLFKAIERAIAAYRDERRFATLQEHAMRLDFSWDKSAKAYQQFYEEILSR